MMPRSWRIPEWVNVANLITAAVLLWALPRCWPHVEAVVGRRQAEARRPAFQVTTRTGETLTAEQLRGRVVFINVWATWCPPCRAEMPALQQLATAYAPDSLVVLGFSVDRGPAAAVDRFLVSRGIRYPNAIVDQGTVQALGGVAGYPTSFLLDRDGVVRHTVMGPIGVLSLRPAIRRLLAEPRATPRSPAR